MTKGALASPDLSIARGFLDFTGVLGHLGVGTIEHAPTGTRVGQRVVAWPHTVCGTCDLCKKGLSTHCPQRTVMGLHKRDGLFATLVHAPARNLVPIPDGVDDDRAALACLLSAALATTSLARVEGKPYVTVLGDGPMGLLVAQLLASKNASVRLLGTHPQRLALCEKWGVKHRHMGDVGKRFDQDLVFDCTGSPMGTRLAMQLVRPRGTIIVKAWPLPRTATTHHEDRMNLSLALSGEVTLIGAGTGTIAHVAEALDLLAQRRIDVESLISRRYALRDYDAAYTTAGLHDAMCVVMDLRGG